MYQLPYFKKLGHHVQQKWRAVEFNELDFHRVALEALQELRPSEHTSANEILEWAFGVERLPEQVDPLGHAGEPPLTVYRDDRFVIDVYFWLDDTTSVHRHTFSGAFCVLEGSSLQTLYDFEPDTTLPVQNLMMLGRVWRTKTEILRAGDARPIFNRGHIAHNLWHLDRPTVTVAVRTIREGGPLPFLLYTRPCLAALHPIQIHNRYPALRKKLALVEMMGSTDHADFVAHALHLLKDAEPFEVYVCLDSLRGHFLGRPHQFRAFLNALKRQHGSLVDKLISSFLEQSRILRIVAQRRCFEDPDRRFVLGLLMHLTDRDDFLELSQEYWDREEPVSAFARRLDGIAQSPEGAKLFELGDLPKSDLQRAFEVMLSASSRDEAIEHAGKDNELAESVNALWNCSMLSGLTN